MSKVLWLGDGGCTTGFGRVTHSIGERLVRDYGHEIRVLAINHQGDDWPSVLDPSQKTPLWLMRPTTIKGDDMYGDTRVLEMLGWGPDVVVMLNDPHRILTQLFSNPHDPQQMLRRMRPIISYFPLDGYDPPPQWVEYVPKVTTAVAMSRFGQEAFPGSDLIYHGVDKDRFWPVSEKPITISTGAVLKTKRECKKTFGLDPDGFLVLRIDSNSGRKDYPSLIKALAPVMQRHSEIQAWFHCAPLGNAGDGASNLRIILSKYGEDEWQSRFFFPGEWTSMKGWPDEDLNALLNAADVFVSTSRGEGFGLTLAEAAMAGLPIIAQNASAIPEVVGPGGKLIEPVGRLTVPAGQDLCLPDVDAFSDAIEYLYSSKGARRDLGQKGREHVLASFDWDEATSKFDAHIRHLTSGDRASEPATE